MPTAAALRRTLAATPSAELAHAAQRGDHQAVTELYRRTAPRARLAARSHCHADDADDAVAEGFTRALARLPQLREAEAVESWMIRCAVRAAVDLSRRRHRQPATGMVEMLSDRAGPPGESAADRVLVAVEHRAAAAALSALPPGPRTLLLLRYQAGLPVAEIARMLGLPEGTVRRRCFEACRAARQYVLRSQLRPAVGACARITDQLCRSVDDRLPDLARRRIDEHLGGCAGCRERRQELADVLAELRRAWSAGFGPPVARPSR